MLDNITESKNTLDKHGKELLNVRNLSVEFSSDNNKIHAVNNLSFSIHSGEIVCMVGESGSGKSACSLSIMRLIPPATGRVTRGSILLNGQDLLKLPEKEMHKIRGRRISTILEDPGASLNPLMTIGKQITDICQAHSKITKREAMAKALELLEMVNIPNVRQRIHTYPHQLSGGMRQRVMIARALAAGIPDLLIADEATTTLDTTLQAQILALLQDIQRRNGMAILLITHDMGIVAQVADWVIIIYAGRKVEEGSVEAIYNTPRHPYTIALLNSIPLYQEGKTRLNVIPGTLKHNVVEGCPFAPRCRYVKEKCYERFPPPSEFEDGHVSWCHAVEDLL